MTRKGLSIAALFILIATMGVRSGQAQDAGFRVHIPFAFSTGTSTVPAGDYTAAPADQFHPNLWLIQNDQDSRAILISAMPNETNPKEDSPKLIFHRYRNFYFLSGIWWDGRGTEVPASKPERALQREMARNGSKPESVHVLASIH